MNIKFIELFAGIGGFRYGLERCSIENIPKKPYGQKEDKAIRDKERQIKQLPNRNSDRLFTCIWANEIDKYACQIYRKNYGKGELYEGDITTYPADNIPDHDLLTGGFPCQAFSIAGKRKGFEDTRGTLFFDIARIINTKRPKYVLLENVKGLLSHDNGDTFRTILWVFNELGYDVQWQVLNSKDFGVPQNRERVFIIGHIRGERRPEVFPIRGASQEPNSRDTEIANCLQSPGHACGNYKGMTMVADYRYDEGLRIRKNNISPTIRQEMKGQDISKSVLLISNVYGGFGETEFREFTDYSPTIRTPKGGGHLPMVKNDMSIRRLTPTECERLQGFPDGWTKGLSDTQRYKCLGNAVTTNVITEIGKRLIDSLI
jgi:DNA (cytosine-5)-methyltransferase 1